MFALKQKKIFTAIATCLVALFCLQSCYKEDAQELYQRQYSTSVTIADLQDQANQFNKQITDLQITINNLRDKEPITKVIYENSGKDTTGVFITLGNTTVYIPYGKNGKDGVDGKNGTTPAFDVTIGADGFWYINGQNTGKTAQGPRGLDGASGKNGCTPTFSAAQDKDNTSDPHFYWTVTWCDGHTEFIMANGQKIQANARDGKDGNNGENGAAGVAGPKGDKGETGATGPQGPKGENGTPGVISPITEVTINDKGDEVTFHTTYPNMPTVTIPLHPNSLFDIHPDKSEDEKGNSVASLYDPLTNELTMEPGQSITFPFTKSTSLKDVTALCSAPFKYKIDQAAKKITLIAPSLQEVTETESQISINFSASLPTSNDTHSKNLVVVIPPKFYVNYFHNTNKNIPTLGPKSGLNTLTVPNTGNYDHRSIVFFKPTNEDKYRKVLDVSAQANLHVPHDKIEEQMRKDTAYTVKKLEKTEDRRYQDFVFVDIVYDKNTTQVNSWTTPEQPNSMMVTANDPHKETKRGYFYIRPISKDIYATRQIVHSTGKSQTVTLRMQRMSQYNVLRMFNPRKWLGIPSTEAFDASKVTVATPSSYGYTIRLTEPEAVAANGFDKFVTEASGVMKYNSQADVLVGGFYTFPQNSSDLYILLITYTRPDGTVVKRVVTHGSKTFQNQMNIADLGGTVTYNVGEVGPNNNTSALYVNTKPENGYGSTNAIRFPRGNESPTSEFNRKNGGVRELDEQNDPF